MAATEPTTQYFEYDCRWCGERIREPVRDLEDPRTLCPVCRPVLSGGWARVKRRFAGVDSE